jgi:hypothetical protein
VREFGIEVGKSVIIDVAAGSYSFAFDTHLCAGNTPPLFGEDVFEAGSSYALTVSKEYTQADTGAFEVENDTGGNLRLHVGSDERTVPSGTSSIQLREGSYTAVATAKCGTRSDRVTITRGSSTVSKYWCSGGAVEARTIGSDTGVGYFDVHNDTGRSLTVRVGGKSYKVKPGTQTIELPKGSYSAAVTAWCGSSSEELTVTDGSRYVGQYSCVSY